MMKNDKRVCLVNRKEKKLVHRIWILDVFYQKWILLMNTLTIE